MSRAVDPDHIDDYEIRSVVRRDESVVVYRVRHASRDEEFELQVPLGPSSTLPPRYLLEVERLVKAPHPNVCRVWTAEIAPGKRGLFSEPASQGTLRDRSGSLAMPPKEVIPLARQLASGLEHLHGLGILHGRLDPEAVRVGRDGELEIMYLPSGEGREALRGPGCYSAPETRGGALRTSHADLFSLGVILYEMLAGRHPLAGMESLGMVEFLESHEFRSVVSCNAATGPQLAALVHRLLAADPGGRPGNAAEVLATLAGCEREEHRSREMRFFLEERQRKAAVFRARLLRAGLGIAAALAVTAAVWLVLVPAPGMRTSTRRDRAWLDAHRIRLRNALAGHPDYRGALKIVGDVMRADPRMARELARLVEEEFRRRPPRDLHRDAETTKGWEEQLRMSGLEDLAREVGEGSLRAVSLAAPDRAGRRGGVDPATLLQQASRAREEGRRQQAFELYRRARAAGARGGDVDDFILVLGAESGDWASFEALARELRESVGSLLDRLAARFPHSHGPFAGRVRLARLAGNRAEESRWSKEVARRDFSVAAAQRLGRMVWERDGAEMVLVPAGSFEMGSERSEWKKWMREAGSDRLATYRNEGPRHRVHLDAYYIDRFPVTWRRYRVFLAALRRLGRHPSPWCHQDEPPRVGHDPSGRMASATRSPSLWMKDDLPVVMVTWWDAHAYARWAGKGLPTEAQWEKAASWDPATGRSRRFPWGDRWEKGRCNTSETWTPRPWRDYERLYAFWRGDPLFHRRALLHPVGSFPGGASPCGAEEMAGGVWEWTSTWYEPRHRPDPASNPAGPSIGRDKVIKGSSWRWSAPVARAAFRWASSPGEVSLDMGFRCASGPMR